MINCEGVLEAFNNIQETCSLFSYKHVKDFNLVIKKDKKGTKDLLIESEILLK